jgi:tRNA splicing endonuclease
MKNFKSFLIEMKISLEYHDTLNPDLWVNDKLKPQVKSSLLNFIDTWREYANIPKNLVKDIVMVGGNANFNYTKQSDIDVHLLIDRNKLGKDRKLIDDYLQDKKTMWTMTHNIKVFTYPLEPYAQDISAGYPKGQGVYSIKNDKWIQKPVHGTFDFKNDKNLKQKVQSYMHMIDHMIKNNVSVDLFDNLKTKIKDMRSSGIQKGGEFSLENLVFKELRNRGYLDKINNYQKKKQDKNLSL